jgi:hypothetical protein
MNPNITSNKRLPSTIDDKLYLGGLYDAQRKEELKELGVKYILVAGKNLIINFPNVYIV